MRVTGSIRIVSFAAALLLGAGAAHAQTGSGEYREDHGLWQLFCVDEPPPNTPPCEVRQLLKNAQGQFVLGLFYTESGDRGLFMLRGAPALDDQLREGVVMQADIGFGTDAFRYVGCDALGCLTQLPMKRVVVRILSRASAITVQLGQDGANATSVTFQLEGFRAALAALRARGG